MRQRAPHAPLPPRPLPGPGRLPPALGGGPWRVPAHPPVGVAWYCGLCKGWRRVGVRARTRATGAQRMWGPAGARGSTEGQRPRGPRVPVRGRVPPRCAGARPPPRCACAGPQEARARGTRPPGRTARTCWRLLTVGRTPCSIPRRVGRCVGGGRAAPKGRDGGPRGHPTSVRGGPGSPTGGQGRIPWSWKAAMRSSHAGRGCPWGGVAMYTWRPVRWGASVSHWHPFAASR